MRTLIPVLAILVLMIALGSEADADTKRGMGHYIVDEEYIAIGGNDINSTNVSALAAGAASTNSAAVEIYDTEEHAISYKYTAANAGASFTLTIQHRTLWGDWVAFDPAISVTLAGASGSGTEALDLPVCGAIRVVQSSDATYATTLVACTINKK
jgi:hypothetical protein